MHKTINRGLHEKLVGVEKSKCEIAEAAAVNVVERLLNDVEISWRRQRQQEDPAEQNEG